MIESPQARHPSPESVHGIDHRETLFVPRLGLIAAPEYREIWEALGKHARDVSLYHGQQWQQVLERAYGMSLYAAVLEDDNGIAAGCLLARSRNPFSRRFIGLPFSDYCWPLSTRPGASQPLLEALAAQLCACGESCELRGTAAPPP